MGAPSLAIFHLMPALLDGPHVHQIKFHVAQLDTMYLTILGISSDSFVSADSSLIDDEHYLLFQRIKYLV